MSKRPWGYQPRPETLGPDWELHPQTHSVRAGLARTGFGETSEALFLNSGFTYTSAEEAFDSFAEETCLLYTSPSPRDGATSRMPSSA